ncbi:MAG: radical SAM protein [Patescibacteria group bacterium]|nr:radical SAM protein [Patescibacteria group bacterium]
MSIEVTPIGVTCNLSCTYCYENPIRDSGNYGEFDYDVDKMIEGLSKYNSFFSVFGGEPLLVDIDTLEKLWDFGYKRYGKNGIQSNGSLITDKHIELFKKYNVFVGISIDGPDELNDARWAGSLEKTRIMTKKTLENIEKCAKNDIRVGLIITIHKLNAGSPERIEKFKAWIKDYDQRKVVVSARLHILQVDYKEVGDALALTPEENTKFMLEMAEFEKNELNYIKFDLFEDIKRILIGNENVTCTFASCDYYSTDAVMGVDGHGNSTNCNRTLIDGFEQIKAEKHGYERQLGLYHTPKEYGGCKDCRFFLFCKAQCPSTAIDSDWRNKTSLCQMYYNLFEYFEKYYMERGVLPLSQSPHLKMLEEEMIRIWASGREARMWEAQRNIVTKIENDNRTARSGLCSVPVSSNGND